MAEQIQVACRERGFFYVTGHGVPAGLLDELADASTEFFALPPADKLEIAMERGGRAWRGFFPVGAELTSGQPDLKEGLYFGAELPGDDPRVLAGFPLHGRNLFPRQVPRLRPLVLAYLDALTSVGQAVLAGVAQSLGLDAGYFATSYTADPTILFRIFHYPPSPPQASGWGVGEHTDYGLVTLLAQDDSGGLQVAAPGGWIDAPPIPGTLVCNIGDMLDRLTGGYIITLDSVPSSLTQITSPLHGERREEARLGRHQSGSVIGLPPEADGAPLPDDPPGTPASEVSPARPVCHRDSCPARCLQRPAAGRVDTDGRAHRPCPGQPGARLAPLPLFDPVRHRRFPGGGRRSLG